MPKVIYRGAGITTIGVDFVDGETYELSEKASKYVLETFPSNFSLVDGKSTKIVKEPTPEVVSEPAVVEEQPAVVEEQPAVVEEQPAVVEEVTEKRSNRNK